MAEIWLRGQIPGPDSGSELIFYTRGQYKADNREFLPPKKIEALLNNRVAMAIIKVTDKQNIFLDAPYIDSNILKGSFSYF